MGKRHVDHESTQDAPTHKKRKTGSSHQQYAVAAATTTTTTTTVIAIENSTVEYNLNQSETADANTTAAADVTYSLTTDLVDGVVLTDLCAKKWRCGKPIGMFKSCRLLYANHILK